MESTLPAMPWYAAATLTGSLLVAVLFWILGSVPKVWGIGLTIGSLVLALAVGWGLPFVSVWWIGTTLLIVSLLLVLVVPGKAMFRGFKDEHLHYMHLWRLPFAFVLLWFYQSGLSSLELTFEGLNYDIVIGLTAPVIASLAFSQKMLNREILIGWNILGLIGLTIGTWLLWTAFETTAPFSSTMQSMPYALIVSYLIPMSFVAHAVCLFRLINKEVKLEA